MRGRTLAGLAVIAAAAAASLTCSPLYVLRAGYEEAKILSRRRPISDVIAAPSTSEETRRRLNLVLLARNYADDMLDLRAGESFTTYSWVDSDTLLLVLSAARKDRFEPYTWWFPIVGRIPYKGYFDFDEAHRTARRLDEQGYDTAVRPSGAFSTLGWFNDPLLNTALRYGDVSLAQTVIHELTHNTIYLPGQAAFNESFATFVGDRGAAAFFCDLEGETGERCVLAHDAWHDTMIFGAFLADLVNRLETLYARTDLARDTILTRREAVFADARVRFDRDVVPELRTNSFRTYLDRPLNNATLIGARLYYQRLDLFEAVYQRSNGNLPAAIREIERAARDGADAPFDAIAELVRANTQETPVH